MFRTFFILWPVSIAEWILIRLWSPFGGFWTIHLIPDVKFLEWMHRIKLLPTRILMAWYRWAGSKLEELDDLRYGTFYKI